MKAAARKPVLSSPLLAAALLIAALAALHDLGGREAPAITVAEVEPEDEHASLTLRLVDAVDHRPLAGVTVEVTGPGGVASRGVTDDRGRCALTVRRLASFPYRLRTDARDHEPADWRVPDSRWHWRGVTDVGLARRARGLVPIAASDEALAWRARPPPASGLRPPERRGVAPPRAGRVEVPEGWRVTLATDLTGGGRAHHDDGR